MNQYLIPANSKKSQLLFGLFQPIDLAILLIGVFVSLIILLVIPDGGVLILTLKLLPLGVSLLLVLPIPYYHNVRVFLTEVYLYYFERPRRYIWRGWCATHGFDAKENK